MTALLDALSLDTFAAFEPAGLFLRSPHVQSVLASSQWRAKNASRRYPELLATEQKRLLSLGEGVRLSAWQTRQPRSAKGLAFLIHGWEGSAHSSYLLSLGGQLYRQGYDVVRLNLRDHGDSHDLNSGLFHSCRLQEVLDAAEIIRSEYPSSMPAIVGGYSLGGNFALRVARALPDCFNWVFAV